MQGRLDNTPRPRQLGLQHGTAQFLAGGFTRPDAKCPVCGDTVYFYQSPYGGRVFFDALGPPWPKHPCTDLTASSHKVNLPEPWHLNEWQPFTRVSIHEISPVQEVYRISGFVSGRECSFFFKATEIVMAEIVRVRKTGRGKFSLSILDFNTVDQTWCTWSGIARTDPQHSRYDEAMLKSPTWKSTNAVAKVVRPKLSRQHSEDMRTCPHCGTLVRFKNLARHVAKVHLPQSTLVP